MKSKSLKVYFQDTIPIVVKCDFHSHTTVDCSHDNTLIHARNTFPFLLLWIFSPALDSHSSQIACLLFCLLILMLSRLKSLLKQDDLTYRTSDQLSTLLQWQLGVLVVINPLSFSVHEWINKVIWPLTWPKIPHQNTCKPAAMGMAIPYPYLWPNTHG